MGMFKMLFATVLMVSVVLVTEAIGQTQNPRPASQTTCEYRASNGGGGEESRRSGQEHRFVRN